MTRQRKIILELLRSTTSHPTADWVYQEARKRLPEISLGTIYRNLNILAEDGEILELDYGRLGRFDGNAANHHHFVCRCCDRVFDANFPVGQEVNRRVEAGLGCLVDDLRLEFYGTCKECLGERT
ncbi:MAG: Fur family transcriptional regulator [Bacillota bacterium]